jgi:diguanylate cyclase (GGDEF)-like protein
VTKNRKPNGRRVSNRDITDLKMAEQAAQKLAYFDVLTGLPNRRMLTDRLGQSIPLAKRLQRSMAIMFIDLDRFKDVNDTFGHDAGDALLVEVARRFAGCIRASDTVARTGGDEFIVLLPEISTASDATAVADKLLEALRAPVSCLTHMLEASASIGIAVLSADNPDDSAELMKKADIAMYAAKQAGRNQYHLSSV